MKSVDTLPQKLKKDIISWFKEDYSFSVKNGIVSLFAFILMGLTYKGLFLIRVKISVLSKLFMWSVCLFNHWLDIVVIWWCITVIAILYNDYCFDIKVRFDQDGWPYRILACVDYLFFHDSKDKYYDEGNIAGYYVLWGRLCRLVIWLYTKGCFIFVVAAYVVNYNYFKLGSVALISLMVTYAIYSLIMFVGGLSVGSYPKQIVLDVEDLRRFFPILEKNGNYIIAIYYRRNKKEYRVFRKKTEGKKYSDEKYCSDTNIYFDNFEDCERYLTCLLDEESNQN